MNMQRLMTAMEQMLDCLCTVMKDIEEKGGPGVCMCAILPGEAVPYDYCGGEDCGGMAWVRLVTISVDEEAADPRLRSCWQPMVADIEVGVIRGYEFNGEVLPDEDTQLAMGIRQVDDAAAVSMAIQCCSEENELRVMSYMPSGPEGGCYGGTWTVRLPL